MIVNIYTVTKIKDFKKYKFYLFLLTFFIFIATLFFIAATVYNIIDKFKSLDTALYFVLYAFIPFFLVSYLKISNSIILALYSYKIYVLKETKYENNFFIKLWLNKKKVMWIKKWYADNYQNEESLIN